MGLFLVLVGSVAFLGPVSYENAKSICGPEPVSKECYIEALQPIELVDYSKLND